MDRRVSIVTLGKMGGDETRMNQLVKALQTIVEGKYERKHLRTTVSTRYSVQYSRGGEKPLPQQGQNDKGQSEEISKKHGRSK